MATQPTGRPRGRPKGSKGKAQPNALRDKFLHLLVSDLMDDYLGGPADNKHAAAHLASYLVAGDVSPLRKPRAKYRAGAQGTRYWQDTDIFYFPKTQDASLENPNQWEPRAYSFVQRVVDWWNDWLPGEIEAHPFFSDPSYRAIRLSPSRILAIYEIEQAKIPAERHVCQWCGHVNRSNPARGERIEEDDPCRKCGATIRVPFMR